MSKAFRLAHVVSVQHQLEESADEAGWVTRQLTGLALLSCNCGYSSGWVPVADLPSIDKFYEEHRVLPLDEGVTW